MTGLRRQLQVRLRLAVMRAGSLYMRTRRIEALLRLWAKRPHERDFRALAGLRHEHGPFLDIGANAGLAAVSFRIYHPDAPIVSIEPNPAHERDLRFVGRYLGNFKYLGCGASDRNGEATLYIPRYRSFSLTPLASFDRDFVTSEHRQTVLFGKPLDDSDFSVDEERVPIRRLDDLDLAPAIVKVDVEGHELPVLRGLERTLRNHRPVVLVEWSREFAPIQRFLEERGYNLFVAGHRSARLEPFDGSNRHLNIFCVPAEGGVEPRRSDVRAAVRS